jgi:ribosome-binding factor A
MASRRAVRVGDLLQREISHILERELKDPRVGFLTITRVELSDDLKWARVFYSVYGNDKERQMSQEGLQSATGFIKRLLGERTRLKYLPDIVFLFDDSLAKGREIQSILDDLKDEEGPKSPEEPE